MANYKLTHTGFELDEAIDKVTSGYKDVSVVTAEAYDITAGKIIVTEDGIIEGTALKMPITIQENNTYLAPLGTSYNEVIVEVPNVYEPSDEGKVIHNGELIEQTSEEITVNGTYDTTLINEISVNTPVVNIQPISITANGEYTAGAGIAYSPITVNVPQEDPPEVISYEKILEIVNTIVSPDGGTRIITSPEVNTIVDSIE